MRRRGHGRSDGLIRDSCHRTVRADVEMKVGLEVKDKKKKKNHCPLPKAETEFQTFSPEVGWSEWPLLCGGGPGAGGRLLTAGSGSSTVVGLKRHSHRLRGTRTGEGPQEVEVRTHSSPAEARGRAETRSKTAKREHDERGRLLLCLCGT